METKCSICKLIEETPDLAFMIDESKNLKALARELQVVPMTLYRHAKNHQNKLMKPQQEENKKDFVEVWDVIIDKGTKRIKNEDIKVNLQSLLKAAKDKADYEAKLDDHGLEAAKLMYEIASGENIMEGEVVTTGDTAISITGAR